MAGHHATSSDWHHHELPVHLCVFLTILLMLVGFSWYASYEPVVESLVEQVKLVLMVSPLLLLLVVQWLSNNSGRGVSASYLNPLPERESLHKAAVGTPWGLAFLLVFLFFMLSYQSQFQERWFPLLAR